MKVSDFGLARVLEDGKDYYRMGDDCPLPVRWMAIESISDLVFTIESDIVSLCLSVCLPACLLCLSVCLSVCLSACLPACLPVCLSVCLYVSLSVRLSICMHEVSCCFLPPTVVLWSDSVGNLLTLHDAVCWYVQSRGHVLRPAWISSRKTRHLSRQHVRSD